LTSEFAPAWALDSPDLAITETSLAICLLRVRAPQMSLIEALGRAFDLSWPEAPNTVAGEAPVVAWMGPGEWAIFAPAEQIASTVAETCRGHLHHLVDLSAGRRLWRVRGPQAGVVVAMGCSLDLHPRTLGPGRCAQSLFAQAPALILPRTTIQAFDIVVDTSFAGHLRDWFSDAFREFQA
jgi:sarcosine oxidase subunit gamma